MGNGEADSFPSAPLKGGMTSKKAKATAKTRTNAGVAVHDETVNSFGRDDAFRGGRTRSFVGMQDVELCEV